MNPSIQKALKKIRFLQKVLKIGMQSLYVKIWTWNKQISIQSFLLKCMVNRVASMEYQKGHAFIIPLASRKISLAHNRFHSTCGRFFFCFKACDFKANSTSYLIPSPRFFIRTTTFWFPSMGFLIFRQFFLFKAWGLNLCKFTCLIWEEHSRAFTPNCKPLGVNALVWAQTLCLEFQNPHDRLWSWGL